MTTHAGVLRSAGSLAEARAAADGAASVAAAGDGRTGERTGERTGDGDAIARRELANLAVVGQALSAAALARDETRGAHARTDHPEISPALRSRFVLRG
jgi:succinate dehydrogenase/fumarate reductase flavoprotein subunit